MKLVFVVMILVSSLSAQILDCSSFNTPAGEPAHIAQDLTEHISGAHFWSDYGYGSCTYSGKPSTVPVACTVVATAQSAYSGGETGTLSNHIFQHVLGATQKGGATQAVGVSATADTEAVLAVDDCIYSNCTISISLNGAGNGGGFTVGLINPSPLWKDTWYFKNQCPSATPAASSCPYPTTAPPYTGGSQTSYYWDPYTCAWQINPSPPSSPIVIDTQNTGFVFTDPRKGEYVTFDIQGNGHPQKLSWTKFGSGNAWLVYDRDGDGVIKDGTEMFGNFTPHSEGPANFPDNGKNGFLALGWYDGPAQGGTGDQIIDKNDKIWKKLRLWIDTHCYSDPDAPCQSLPSELHTLESMGITSLSAVYSYDPQNFDKIGNRFKYWAVLNPELATMPTDGHGRHLQDPTRPPLPTKRSTDNRKMYDVFLVSVP